jgi:hypothetical protein
MPVTIHEHIKIERCRWCGELKGRREVHARCGAERDRWRIQTTAIVTAALLAPHITAEDLDSQHDDRNSHLVERALLLSLRVTDAAYALHMGAPDSDEEAGES